MMMVNCTNQWPAQTSWTFDKFLSEGDGLETWRTDFINNMDIINLWGQKEHIQGRLISEIMRNNGSVRMFEVLGRRRSKMFGPDIKTNLMEDYSKPDALPDNMFELSGVLTDYQWAILRETK